jgi:hypothetical protein
VNGLRKVAALVVVLLGVAALLFALRSCSSDDGAGDSDPEASATATPAPSLAPARMATTRIEQAIKERLDANAGRPTRIECPERVSQKIGTDFSCEVFFDDEPGTAAIATAAVTIDGPDGHFVWKSTPKSQDGA